MKSASTGAGLHLKVVLRVADLAVSRRFYTEILGLQILIEWEEEQGNGCIMRCGDEATDGEIELYQMTELDERYDPRFGQPFSSDKIDLQLRTPSLTTWITNLADKWPFEGPETLPWGQRWIKLRDPDHLLVAIYEELD